MVTLTGHSLTIPDLVKIAYFQEQASLNSQAIEAIKASRRRFVEFAESGKSIYGVNTGFGIFAEKRISRNESINLNRNLIFSHALATGNPLPETVVRAAMAIRINTLAKGASGIQFEIVETLLDMLNKKVTPIVSSKGSLGSSGDLCLLAQIGLVIIGDEKRDEKESGMALYNGEIVSGKKALEIAGIKSVVFSYKDGLALINGATFSAAISALQTYEAKELANMADISTALSLEALCGSSTAFHPGIHALRNLEGQSVSAKNISTLIRKSSFIDSSGVLQDAYSVRCAPQVHGSVRDTIQHAEKIITAEINAATDNPLMVGEKEIISGGNFHGEPIGMVADFLSIALTELGAISERRIFRLLDEKLSNGLPGMLVDPNSNLGLNSGVMILQYTAAALVLENQTYATPDSIRSLPTSANQEDHNANSFNAAVHLMAIAENTMKVIAIELYCASRGLHIRKKMQPELDSGLGTSKIYTIMQDAFPHHLEDVQWRMDLEKFYEMLKYPCQFRETLLSVVN